MKEKRKLSREQIGVLCEYLDLLQNGYTEILQFIGKELWMFKLRHLSNGRVLTLVWTPKAACIKEGRKIIKVLLYDAQMREH